MTKAELYRTIRHLANSSVGTEVRQRLEEFATLPLASNEQWFEELCFCILAANSKSETSWAIQKELKFPGLMQLSQAQLAQTIRRNKHRFHNTKARYIVTARSLHPLKETVMELMEHESPQATRVWLVENVTGFGMKEASHFLRNTGYFHFAILDRHVLNLLHEHKIIRRPPTLSQKQYVRIERIFQRLAEELQLTCAELDFYCWYLKAGKILK